LLLNNQRDMPPQGSVPSTPPMLGSPPTPPCKPKADLLPPGGELSHSTPAQDPTHLLASLHPIDATGENHKPSVHFLQPRQAPVPGQDQKPQIPPQCHHGSGKRDGPTCTRCGFLTPYLSSPNRLPLPCSTSCSLLRETHDVGKTIHPFCLGHCTGPPILPLPPLCPPPPLYCPREICRGKYLRDVLWEELPYYSSLLG